MDVMLDLETLGTVPRCVILSIGAVAFDHDTLGETFHRHIDVRSSQRAGLMIDGATFMWWLRQSDAARQELLTAQTGDLASVLEQFAVWMKPYAAARIWAKGPSFDCTILAAAYRAIGMTPPWDYFRERCVRTALDMAAIDDTAAFRAASDVAHSALGDAMAQARAVQRAQTAPRA